MREGLKPSKAITLPRNTVAKKGKSNARQSRDSLKAKLKKWLQDSGMYISSQTQPGTDFMLVGRFPKLLPPPGQPLPFHIFMQTDDPSFVTVLANVTIASEHRSVLQTMEEDAKVDFFEKLKMDLLFRCQFGIQREQKTNEYLGFQLADMIYLDAPITKQLLIKTIENIFRSYILISSRLQELSRSSIVAQ